MAMLNCAECGSDVSTSARSCPQCGASRQAMRRRPRRPVSKSAKLGIVALFAAIVALVAIMSDSSRHPKSASEQKDDKQERMRLNVAVGAVKALRASLRNPESLAFDKILVSEDGDAVCIRYRAQNGFSGLNQERFVMTDQDTYSTAKGWNRHCAHRPLYDYTDTLPTMMKLTGQ